MEKLIFQEWGIVGIMIIMFMGMVQFLKTQLISKLDEIEIICIKLIDRWNRSDEIRDRRHEQLLEQINRITDDINFLKGKKRKDNFNYLKNQFSNLLNLRILDETDKKFKQSYYCMNIILLGKLRKKRLRIIEYLKSKKIGTSIYYPQPVPRMTYYKKKYGYKKDFFLNASEISDYSISLPVGPHLNKKDLLYLANNLKSIVRKFNYEKN